VDPPHDILDYTPEYLQPIVDDEDLHENLHEDPQPLVLPLRKRKSSVDLEEDLQVDEEDPQPLVLPPRKRK
jgi:hypothetical protein